MEVNINITGPIWRIPKCFLYPMNKQCLIQVDLTNSLPAFYHQTTESRRTYCWVSQGFVFHSFFYFIFLAIYCNRDLRAVTRLLPDCEVGIHGNRDLKAHCSARDNRRDESSVSGCAFEKWVDAAMALQRNLCVLDDKKISTQLVKAGGFILSQPFSVI